MTFTVIVIIAASFNRSSRYAASPTNTKLFLRDDSDGSDIGSCFDAEDELEETDADTEPTNIDTDTNLVDIDIGGCDEVDLAWIAGDDNAYPLKYYLD